MKKMHEHQHVFSSESVSEGHPDKVADAISDAILDACLKRDKNARVACETMVGPDVVINMGEITCKGFEKIDTEAIARRVVKEIGYTVPEEHFSYDTFKYVSHLHGQSPDIAQGVNRALAEEQGAGDQGMMFGYATDETPELMPVAIVWAHKLLRHFAELRKSGTWAWLRPDAKAQLSVVYVNGAPVRIDTVVVSHQTTEKAANKKHYDLIRKEAKALLSESGMITTTTKFLVNPTGKFVIGGPCGDSGLTGRKIIVDTYGGMAAHGGGAFSGKDPSKVDRSAAYYARYAAKNIVAAGLAKRCQIQVAYAIGVAAPVSFSVQTFGTNAEGVTNESLEAMLKESGIFDFRPYGIQKDLGLLKPIYSATAAYGHFGRDGFPWEKTDKAAKLRKRFIG